MELEKASPEAAHGITAAVNAALRAGILRLDRQPKPSIIFFDLGGTASPAASIVTPYGVVGFILSPRVGFRRLVAQLGAEAVARTLFAADAIDLRKLGRAFVIASFYPQRGDGNPPTFSINRAFGSGRAAAELAAHVKPAGFYAVTVSDDEGTPLVQVPEVGLRFHEDGGISFSNGDEDHAAIRRLTDEEVAEWKALGRPSDADSIAALYYASAMTAEVSP